MPNASRTTLLAAVRTTLQIPAPDQLVLDSDILRTFLDLALSEFSIDRPALGQKQYVATARYNRELPSDWVPEFSYVRDIRIQGQQAIYEVDSASFLVVLADGARKTIAAASTGEEAVTVSPVTEAAFFMPEELVQIRDVVNGEEVLEYNWVATRGNATSGEVELVNALAADYSEQPTIARAPHIRFIDGTPANGEIFIVEYTKLHVLNEDDSTIGPHDFASFVTLLSALVAESLAAKFSQHTASGRTADAVDYSGLATLWATNAQGLRERYAAMVGKRVGAGDTGGTGGGRKAGGAMMALRRENLNSQYSNRRRFIR